MKMLVDPIRFSISGRTRRLFSDILGGSLGRCLSLLAPLFIMPPMLDYLGTAGFGIWMTALSITSMALFADLGIGNSLLTRIAAASGRADWPTARRDIAGAYALLSAIAGTIILFIAIGALLVSFFGSGDMPTSQLAIVGTVFFVFAITLPSTIIQRIMYARQQMLEANAWPIAAALLSISLCLIAIWARIPTWLVVLAYGVPVPLVLGISAWLYFDRYPYLRPSLSQVSLANCRPLLMLSSRFFILSLLTSIALNIDSVLINAQLGPEIVTSYSIPAKLGSLLSMMITVMFMPMWAANGEALARGDVDWVRSQTLRMAIIGSVAIALAGLLLTLGGDTVIKLWSGRSFAGQTKILAGIALFCIIMSFTSPFNMLLNAAEKIDCQIKGWILFIFLSTILKYFSIKHGYVWPIPIINLTVYIATISPVSIYSSYKLLNDPHKISAGL